MLTNIGKESSGKESSYVFAYRYFTGSLFRTVSFFFGNLANEFAILIVGKGW